MRLTTNQKERIKGLLRRMGSRQKELSAQMGYASGNLSEFLNETKDKGVEPETWRSLVESLDKIAAARPRLVLSDPSIQADLDDIRRWADSGAGKPGAVHLYPPRGALPLGAVNYVARRCDDEIAGIVRRGGPVILQGGISTGRSSWLIRLQEAARATGATVVTFDEALLSRINGDDPIGGFVAHLGTALELPVLSEIATHHGDHRTIAREVIGAVRQASLTAPLYVLVDETDSWPGNQPHRRMIEFVTQMQLELAGGWGQRHAHPISIASALTPSEWSAMIGSKLHAQSTVVKLGFLEASEVRDLARHYGLSNSVADDTRAFSGGHPSHTQTILWACHRGSTVTDAVARAQDLDEEDGWLGVSTRLTANLQRVSADQGIDMRQMLKKFVAGFGPTATGPTLSPGETTLLKSLGMLDGPARNPVTSLFFLSAAQAWLDEVEI
ncbi:MAG: hypothetical protein HQL41_09635 [Alphaproteobacteria bacterium]|nr:hypothetical protein [Alphaproteobacteria bacterium]